MLRHVRESYYICYTNLSLTLNDRSRQYRLLLVPTIFTDKAASSELLDFLIRLRGIRLLRKFLVPTTTAHQAKDNKKQCVVIHVSFYYWNRFNIKDDDDQ